MLGTAEALSLGTKLVTQAPSTLKSVKNKVQGIQKTKAHVDKVTKARNKYAKSLFEKGGPEKPTEQNIKDKQHLRKYDRKLLHKLGLSDDEIDWD